MGTRWQNGSMTEVDRKVMREFYDELGHAWWERLKREIGWPCGFTRYYDKNTAASWHQIFSQNG